MNQIIKAYMQAFGVALFLPDWIDPAKPVKKDR